MKQPEMQYVRVCIKCRGKGEIMGATMRIFCPLCYGHRFISIEESEPLSLRGLCEELFQARKALALAVGNLNSKPLTTGPEAGYYDNNGRGAGGSNFTGD